MTPLFSPDRILFTILFFLCLFQDLDWRWGDHFFFHILDRYVYIALTVLGCFCFIRNELQDGWLNVHGWMAGLLCGSILFAFLGNIVYSYQPWPAVISDLYLCLRFFPAMYVGGWLASHFDWEKNSAFIARQIDWITVFFIIGLLMFCCLDFFPAREDAFNRYAVRLFFRHETMLGLVCVLMMSIQMALKPHLPKRRMWGFLALACIGVLTCKTVICVSVLLGIVLDMYLLRFRKKIHAGILCLFLLGAIGLGSFNIYKYFVKYSHLGRAQLYRNSLVIANNHFPLGCGFAAYGSPKSIVYYSPVYRLLHMDEIRGFRPDDIHGEYYITDGFFPMLIAQFGWIGTSFFCMALLLLFLMLLRLQERDTARFSAAFLACSAISFAAVGYNINSISFPFFLWIGALLFGQTWKDDFKRRFFLCDLVGKHSGLNYYLDEFARFLKRNRLRVKILSNYSVDRKKPFFYNIFLLGKISRFFALFWALGKLFRKMIICSEDCFVILSFGNKWAVPLLLLTSACSNVVFDIHEVFAKEEKNRFLRGILKFIYRYRLSCVICHTEDARCELQQCGFSGKIFLVPHFCYRLSRSFREKNIPDDLIRAFEPRKKNLLFFGNITAAKGIDQLVNLINSLPERTAKKCNFILAGSCRDDAFQPKQIREQSRVKIILRKFSDDECFFLYKKCDLVLLPYRECYQSGVLEMAFLFRKIPLTTPLAYFMNIKRESPSLLEVRPLPSWGDFLEKFADGRVSPGTYYKPEDIGSHCKKDIFDNFAKELGRFPL